MDRLHLKSPSLIARTLIMGALCAIALAAPHPARAQTAAPAVLAASCFSCHGPNGASTSAMPALDKMGASVITSVLKAFRSGDAQGTVMNRIAKGYTDDEIAALGQYFSSQQR